MRYEYIPPEVLSEHDPSPDESTPNFDPWPNRAFIPRAIRKGPTFKFEYT